MTTRIESNQPQSLRVEGVAERREADHELKHRFLSLLRTNGDTYFSQKEKQTGIKCPAHILEQLSKSNSVVKWNNAELTRTQNKLSFKLLNGPMMGLTVVASFQANGVSIEMIPKTKRQYESLIRIKPKIESSLNRFAVDISIEVQSHE
ncbi:hypothetical protein [Vibrio caribbeanicus]|uniref:hypothetical protein n=1 Tax=Vibrio caribbeanicus TaxID=701175 RepID=UPI0030D8EB9D